MLRVGLTGGLASGKSFVAEQLATLGCFVIHADKLGHDALLPGGEAYGPAVVEFGQDILDAEGLINRRRLAAIVFNDPDRLARLSAIVHPAVSKRIRLLLENFSRVQPDGIAVVEAAILIETGAYKSYDRLIVAVCTEQEQLERAMRRDGLTREEALARLRRQLPLSEKVKYADYVIDTSGAKERTIEQTRAVYESLRSIRQ
ncbi:MAG TPA: dephospho-CoA kinase [Bryobacteraceae bacterium]|jgi:dephospho-CoA kinase|nr:dephospho-CoA kinase [Bryobacteraceae bacterium]